MDEFDIIKKVSYILELGNETEDVKNVLKEFLRTKDTDNAYSKLQDIEDRIFQTLDIDEDSISSLSSIPKDRSTYLNFISFKDEFFVRAFDIQSVSKFEEYKYGRLVPYIRLNDSYVNAHVPFQNKDIFYNTIEERDKDLSRIKIILKNFAKVRFL